MDENIHIYYCVAVLHQPCFLKCTHYQSYFIILKHLEYLLGIYTNDAWIFYAVNFGKDEKEKYERRHHITVALTSYMCSAAATHMQVMRCVSDHLDNWSIYVLPKLQSGIS